MRVCPIPPFPPSDVFMALAYDLGDAKSPYGSVHSRYKIGRHEEAEDRRRRRRRREEAREREREREEARELEGKR